MVDTTLIVEILRRRGHEVGHVIPVPDNAGTWELQVDGALLSLEEVRALMEDEDEPKREVVIGVGEVVIVEEVAPDIVVMESVPVVITKKV